MISNFRQRAATELRKAGQLELARAILPLPKNESARERNRRNHLRVKYGVTPEWYDAKTAEWGGVCEICGSSPKKNSYLCVDHNHQTGELRGLICRDCNITLGIIKDNPLRLDLMELYLNRYGEFGSFNVWQRFPLMGLKGAVRGDQNGGPSERV